MSGRHCGPLDLEDLTIEIVLTFRVPRSLHPINSGPNSAETLYFLCVSCLTTERYLVQCSDNRVILAPLLCFGLLLYIRLVMSTISRPTSSSDRPSPSVGHPSSPVGRSSSSSSSSSSSTTNSLSVGVANVPL